MGPAALGFRQGDKPFFTISAGKKGATFEMANKASLSIVQGKVGVGTDPTELFHVKGGNMLMDGTAQILLKSKASGTKIYAKNGLRLTGGQDGKIHMENSNVHVTNAGMPAMVKILAGPAKDAGVQLVSGQSLWKVVTSQASAGSLFFKNKRGTVTMTKEGHLGVRVTKPAAAVHAKGSALFESASKPVFTSLKASAESQAAGVRLTSGSEMWRVMTTGSGSKTVGGGSLEFSHGTKTHVVISKTGALGVGLGSPMAGTSLHVKGPSMYDVGKGKGKIVI